MSILVGIPFLNMSLTCHRFGFDISSMSAIIGTKQYLEFFDNPHGIIQDALGSALAAGAVVGSLIAGPVWNRFGRRDSIFFAVSGGLLALLCRARAMGLGS